MIRFLMTMAERWPKFFYVIGIMIWVFASFWSGEEAAPFLWLGFIFTGLPVVLSLLGVVLNSFTGRGVRGANLVPRHPPLLFASGVRAHRMEAMREHAPMYVPPPEPKARQAGPSTPNRGAPSSPNGEEAAAVSPKSIAEEEAREIWEAMTLPEGVLSEIRGLQKALQNPEEFRELSLEIPKGMLLKGPPGTGKTTIAKAIAGSAGYTFYNIKPSEAQSMWVGQAEKKIAEIYETARRNAPSIVFWDEFDAVASSRASGSGGGSKSHNSLLNQILQEIDGFETGSSPVFTCAATNRPDILDDAVLSRLNYQIEIPLPDEEARANIIKHNMRGFMGRMDVSVDDLVKRTEGFSGRDIKNLAQAVGWRYTTLEAERVTEEIFEHAFSRVRKSDDPENAKGYLRSDRDEAVAGVAPETIPPEEARRTWEDMVLPEDVLTDIRGIQTILEDPDAHIDEWDTGIPTGMILEGPPGTGKTTIAKALAGSAGYTFFNIMPSEAKSMWIGQAEKKVAAIYEAARKSAPSIVFWDEFDAVASSRAGGGAGGSQAHNSMLNQLLQEIDGFRSGEAPVFTCAATNRPDILDDAVLSRLNYRVEVPLPTEEARRRIIENKMGKFLHKIDGGADRILERTEGFSGRDIKNLAEAIALTAATRKSDRVTDDILDHAFRRAKRTGGAGAKRSFLS